MYPKPVDALIDSIQKYELHSMFEAVRYDLYIDDRPKLYEEVYEHHSPSSYTVSGRGTNEHDIEHDKLFGRWFKTRRYDRAAFTG